VIGEIGEHGRPCDRSYCAVNHMPHLDSAVVKYIMRMRKATFLHCAC